jgi:hypothetical protein
MRPSICDQNHGLDVKRFMPMSLPPGLPWSHPKREEETTMQAIMTALLLVALLGVSASVAFAGDEQGSDQDHGTLGSQEVVQTEPIQVGTLSGPEKAPSMPYFELRQENRE